uniref:Phospholipase D n=1 Tax=Nelumbo nucifera TaxID=4432 RepID=A0A822YLZ8_NELNU|nr:TPA_asm: hypothetical protein HUJ06_010777 [Nelumbo nucifera]
MDGSRSDSTNISSVASSSGGNGTGHDNTPSSGEVLLHGKLDICIVEAQNLPGSRRLHRKSLDKVHDIRAKCEKFLRNREPSSFKELGRKMLGALEKRIPHSSEPFVSICLSNAKIGRTRVIRNSRDPVWKQNFSVLVAHYASEVRFEVKNHDIIGAEMTGAVEIQVAEIYSGHLGKVEGNFTVAKNGKKTGAELRILIQYTPVERLNLYNLGPHFPGIEGAYFPLRKGGVVKLYQDAHVPDGYLPELKLDDGLQYEHGKCWQDISEAIDKAKHLIYIAGWSVYRFVRLQRESNNQQTLGELLLRRSRERVRVAILAWDDPSSWHIFGFNTRGKMNTHDEELRSFFKKTQVNVLLCNRKVAGKEYGLLKKQEAAAIYTHHQKILIVDSDAGNNKRKIIAFIGGLDLTEGRYDTPSHPLFGTQQTVHSGDFLNPNFKDFIDGCPRQPWHDLHCKIEGPAAYDILDNFEARWRKESRPFGIEKCITVERLKHHRHDALLDIQTLSDILDASNCVSEDDPESSWNVQVFRSIDSNSVIDFPKDDPTEVEEKNLVYGKNVVIDMSIHSAYVTAIRAAQNFIYIENQYFIGSSYNWTSRNQSGADNLIPMEIALKIANKIKEKKRFSAYIVIPMWPEGDPASKAVQMMLYLQLETMRMMYKMVYEALEKAGLEKKYTPQDYLNFFCLGNREALDQKAASSSGESHVKAQENTPQERTKRSRRFMVYVHSKGMIVDDEYVILGSANINQRSMEGNRDTEIAIGAFQPSHTWETKQSGPRGQVYGYRMSLWAEHMGRMEECFAHPESLDCTRRVRELAEQNWQQYASEEVTDMRGHLLKYPVKVEKGKIELLDDCLTFPDHMQANIKGKFDSALKNLTI